MVILANIITYLAIGLMCAAMLAGFMHLNNRKTGIPFQNATHAKAFACGLILLTPIFASLALQALPLVPTSLGTLMLAAATVGFWFMLTSDTPIGFRRWGIDLWYAVPSAVLASFFFIIMGNAFITADEATQRRAYLRDYEPAQYAALLAKEEAQRQAIAQVKAKAEADQRDVTLAKQREQEEYRKAVAKYEEKEKLRAAEEAKNPKKQAPQEETFSVSPVYLAECKKWDYFMATMEQLVGERLKSPSTADFASWRDSEVQYAGTIDSKTKLCTWRIKSYVDSQNSFGATIRTHFFAQLVMLKDADNTVQLTEFVPLY